MNLTKISIIINSKSCYEDIPVQFIINGNIMEGFLTNDKIIKSFSEEIPCDFEEWQDTIKDDKWATRILKIWFSLLKNFSIVNKWAKWPEILNDSAFRPKAIKKVEDVVEELD